MGCAATKPRKSMIQRVDDKSTPTQEFNPHNNPIVRRRFLSQQKDIVSPVLTPGKIADQI